MSKQDRTYTRTASALEQKYNFGQSFAEVYGLVSDARKAAEEASKAIDELNATLTPEEIFNRLTNYGEEQGIYREDGKIYINANYIKSGKIAAEYIDAEHLEVDAANVKGTLTADQIVLTGAITWEDLSSDTQSEFSTMITEELMASPVIIGGQFYGNTFDFIDTDSGSAKITLTSTLGATLLNFLSIYGYTDAFGIPVVYFGSDNSVPATFDFGYVNFNCRVSFNGEVDFSNATVTGL